MEEVRPETNELKTRRMKETCGDSDSPSILGVLKSFCRFVAGTSYSQLAAEVPDGDDVRLPGDVAIRRVTFGGVGPSSVKP